jgi:predicted NAD-dependent protein-ADP-ribosyltransferase YbiA (DUF1768 family)
MVYSNIQSLITYKDTATIDPEDIGYESTLYEMDILNKTVLVVLGKAKHTFTQRGVVYFPIYLVSNDKVRSQIGLFELHKDKVMEIMDEDNRQEPDVSKLHSPLFYGFINETYIDRNAQESELYLKHLEQALPSVPSAPSAPVITPLDTEGVEKATEKSVEKEDDDTDEVMKVKVRPSQISAEVEKANVLLEKGVFERDPLVKITALLPEETEEDAKDIKSQFAETAKQNWVQKFMKNPHYDIHEVEANGDCFFAVLRDAFKQIGLITTVPKLRAIVAKNATDKIFQDRFKLFADLEGTLREYTTQLKTIKDTLEKDLKQRAKKSFDKPTVLATIMEEIETKKTEYADILQKKNLTEQLKEETVGNFMADSLESFREYIQTPKYWADSWAISVMEIELQVKVIVLSERSYLERDYNGVLMCGELDEELEKAKNFSPKYYIIASHSGNHFRLISYKDKRILEFQEIPYHIKAMVINKCMERDSGAFYIIPEFRNLKRKMGLDENEGAPVKEEISPDEYDSNTIFAFYSQSAKTPYPGKGAQELMAKDRQTEFVLLKKIVDWRKKLDDSWMEAPFSLDGHKWASVEHYYQGAKFKKQHPDFSLQFSLDSQSEISKDVGLAQGAGSKSGGPKTRVKVKQGFAMRPKNVVIDPDFYGTRSEQERLNALRAKFSQNVDLKSLLLATKNAKLVHIEKGHPTETDHLLMKIRHELQESNG